MNGLETGDEYGDGEKLETRGDMETWRATGAFSFAEEAVFNIKRCKEHHHQVN